MSIGVDAIHRAEKSWREARKTNPPCPIHTQMALAHYQDAASHIGQRIKAMEEILENESK